MSRTLARVIAPGADVALLDFPEYANVGDSAIWCGERQFMRAQGLALRYVSSLASFSPTVLRRAMPRGVVLIQGGGNFGSLWPAHQRHREQMLRELRDYRVVQLPQSLCFEDAASLAAAREAIAAHPDFTLLVRDRNSRRIAEEQLGARTILCCDCALLLHGSLRRTAPDVDCLVLARSDHERAIDGLAAAPARPSFSIASADWLDEPPSLTRAIALGLRRRALGRYAHGAVFQRLLAHQWDALAWQRVQRGCRLLSRGRVVVTDRLHAHILATLLGIPNIVLDNSYGKISSFMEEWTAGQPGVRRAASLDDAMALCAQALHEAPRGAAVPEVAA